MLDPAMTALAATAGTALVQAMVTDSWVTTRDRAARILGRGNPARRQGAVEQMEATRASLRSGKVVASTAESRWQGRLEAILEDHPELAEELAQLVENTGGQLSERAVVTQTVRAGNRATVNQAARDINATTNRRTNNFGGILVVIAVIAVLLIVGGWGVTRLVVWIGDATGSPAITADTHCRDYLQASTEDREHAVKTIGVELGATGAGNPMARLNVDYMCGQSPETPVGEIIAKQNY